MTIESRTITPLPAKILCERGNRAGPLLPGRRNYKTSCRTRRAYQSQRGVTLPRIRTRLGRSTIDGERANETEQDARRACGCLPSPSCLRSSPTGIVASVVEVLIRRQCRPSGQVEAARQSRSARVADRAIMRPRAGLRAMAHSASREAEASAVEPVCSERWRHVRAAVGPSDGDHSRETTLRDVARVAQNEDGMRRLSRGTATPGFETFPPRGRILARGRAHSRHPPSRVRCASCHQGDGEATSFSGAGHSTGDPAVRAASGRAWADSHAPGAMLPVAHTEAACVTCHLGERYQPGRAELNEALATVERAGCYACHVVPGMEQTPRRGPDLRRINGKLSPEWVTQWLAEPGSIKPATWMPAFWGGRQVLETDERAAIDAVVAYLFSNSDTYSPAVAAPPRGDGSRGQKLVERSLSRLLRRRRCRTRAS